MPAKLDFSTLDLSYFWEEVKSNVFSIYSLSEFGGAVNVVAQRKIIHEPESCILVM